MSSDAAKWVALGALLGVSATLALRPSSCKSTSTITTPPPLIAIATTTTTVTTTTTTNTTTTATTTITTPSPSAPTIISLLPSSSPPCATRGASFSHSPALRPLEHPFQQHFVVAPFFRKGKMRLHIKEGPEAYRLCMRPYLNSLPLPKYLLSLIWGTNRLARLAHSHPKYFRFVGEFLIAPSNNLEEMLTRQPDVSQWTPAELSANFRC